MKKFKNILFAILLTVLYLSSEFSNIFFLNPDIYFIRQQVKDAWENI